MPYIRLEIPKEIVSALAVPPDVPVAAYVESELLKLIAIRLYEEMKININVASRLCDVSVQDFNDILNEHGVDIRYDVGE
jgi:predicted HTH domain antitoxin